MMKFMAAVLSVIAVGVLGIAYGLLSPRLSMNAVQANQAYPVQTMPAGVVTSDVRPASAAMMQPMQVQPMQMQAARMPDSQMPGSQVQTAVRGGAANQPEVVYVPASTTSADTGVVHEPVARPVRTVYTRASSRDDDESVTIERSPKRDWKRSAMIIGGTSAAGAGVGAIVGGKKGALIGAAIGGGASTIYQTTR